MDRFAALIFLWCLPLFAHAFGVVPSGSGTRWKTGGLTFPYSSAQDAANAALSTPSSFQYTAQCNSGEFVTMSVSSTATPSGGSGLSIPFSLVQVFSRISAPSGDCSNQVAATVVTPDATVAIGQVESGCPVDSTQVGADCVCNLNFKAIAGACVPYSCNGAQPPAGGLSWAGTGSSTCYQGCVMTATGVRGYNAASGLSSAAAADITVGGACQSSSVGVGTNPQTAPPPVSCPVPQCPGTVNGQAVCVPCSSSATPGPSATASAPAGVAPPLIPNAPAGATSSTSSTTCAAGSCTTTINYYGANGNQLGQSSETKPETSFCKENPGSPLCKASSISGSCAAVACDGDAIQCAMAKEQARRACELFETTTPLSELGTASANGEATPEGHPGRFGAASNVNLAFSSSIDTTNRVGGGCPQDESFVIGGQTLTLPFGRLCGPLTGVGQVAVGIAMLMAAGIVFRG